VTIYDTNREGRSEQRFADERVARAGYRPGWIWIPVAVTLLLIILLVATGFIYGGYSDRVRGYDNGTAIEQTGGDTTMPSLATPMPLENAPETGAPAPLNRPVVRPEEAPPLANDGQ
jgi:hypothetical protein